ncbi:hypothetical protein TNCV_2018191 [Trichonephila clavipes]|nr:hypothetical protein TNCV_2018191 [Trichonephila clavipes]
MPCLDFLLFNLTLRSNTRFSSRGPQGFETRSIGEGGYRSLLSNHGYAMISSSTPWHRVYDPEHRGRCTQQAE